MTTLLWTHCNNPITYLHTTANSVIRGVRSLFVMHEAYMASQYNPDLCEDCRNDARLIQTVDAPD